MSWRSRSTSACRRFPSTSRCSSGRGSSGAAGRRRRGRAGSRRRRSRRPPTGSSSTESSGRKASTALKTTSRMFKRRKRSMAGVDYQDQANITGFRGTVDQDRLAGIRGITGARPALTDVTTDLANADLGTSRTGGTQIAREERRSRTPRAPAREGRRRVIRQCCTRRRTRKYRLWIPRPRSGSSKVSPSRTSGSRRS